MSGDRPDLLAALYDRMVAARTERDVAFAAWDVASKGDLFASYMRAAGRAEALEETYLALSRAASVVAS